MWLFFEVMPDTESGPRGRQKERDGDDEREGKGGGGGGGGLLFIFREAMTYS